MGLRIYSIGHSTRSLDELLRALQGFHIRLVVDVRSYPGSRRSPQFGRDQLEREYRARGISYHHHPDLGGFRRLGLGERSQNLGLRSEGFRNYADYAQSADFDAALEELIAWAAEHATCYMCAEKLYARCHRFIISDVLASRGHDVVHIVDTDQAVSHVLTESARVTEGHVTYPPPGGQDRLF